jgi:NAD(P)H-dependent FMN reductase
MKVLGLSCGTLNGSNDAMCKEALMAAQEAGAEVEFINLHQLDIKHCTGCKACVMGLFSGRGNACVIKDDFQWLVDKMYDADGIVWAVPIFEKCAPGIFHTVMDRFGPRLDRGNVMIAQKIAENGGKPIDPKYLKEKVVSFMGIGGSDWATRIQCDFNTMALTPKWTVIDNECFQWSLDIIMNDEALAKAHQIGSNLAQAAKKIADGTFVPAAGIFNGDYKGAAGVCPYCHSNNFFLKEDGTAICCLCGTEGVMKNVDGKYVFEFDADTWLPHAHDSISGKFIHGDDIQRNEGKARAAMSTDEAKARKAKYKEFIQSSKPVR